MSERTKELLAGLFFAAIVVVGLGYWILVAQPAKEARWWSAYDCATAKLEDAGVNFTYEGHKAAYEECYVEQNGGVE